MQLKRPAPRVSQQASYPEPMEVPRDRQDTERRTSECVRTARRLRARGPQTVQAAAGLAWRLPSLHLSPRNGRRKCPGPLSRRKLHTAPSDTRNAPSFARFSSTCTMSIIDWPSQRRYALTYTSDLILSGIRSAAWLMTIPPMLCPTSSTGSFSAVSASQTAFAYLSSEMSAVGAVLAQPREIVCYYPVPLSVELAGHSAPAPTPVKRSVHKVDRHLQMLGSTISQYR